MLRHRRPLLPTMSSSPGYVPFVTNNEKKRKEATHEIHWAVALVIIILIGLLYGGVYLIGKSLPSAYTISDEKDYPDVFIAERAQNLLKGLTDLGPRVVGSKENEILAVNYINIEIDNILKHAHTSFTITKDYQLTSGAYLLELPRGMINAYKNVQNIMVKIDGKNTNESILINAHFDSVPTSPGASDDGIMIAVMLETLRKLTQFERQFERNIIFLFNGAEESALQAAHGFITQHIWAKTCKTIVNLEAAGYAGRAILFQSGPDRSPALMYHYSSVPYPFAQAAGEEIFQSNLIPSDTDFRVFRDFGGLSGFDMAFAQNGYRYHTHFDRFDELPQGSFQHAGGNVLALVKSLATDPNPLPVDDEKVVYFDVFNWFLISYSMLAAYIANITVSVASVLIAILSAKYLDFGFNKSSLLYITYTTVTILGSWIIAAGLSLLIGLILDACNSTMSWYGSPIIIIGLYIAPIIGTLTGVMWIFNRFGPHKGKSLGTQSQIQMHITRLIWALVLFVGTLLKIRSVYVLVIVVLFNTVASIIILLARWQHTARKWLICAFIFALLPVIMMMYCALQIYMLFIPVSGRNGAHRNPELIISALTALFTVLIYSNYASFHVLIKKQFIVPIVLFAGFIISFIVVVSNGVFPYSGDSNSPTPQRYMLFHTNRIHHDVNGSVQENSGIFIHNMDRNSPRIIQSNFEVNGLYDVNADCEKYPVCGMPIKDGRMVDTVKGSSWKPFHKAIIKEQISMKTTSEILSSNVKQYRFDVEGPDHLTLFIRPHSGSKILRTSLVDVETDELLFINHVYGKIKTNLEFTVDVQAANLEQPLMDFVVSGKYYNLNGQERKTKEFDEFVAKFPDWTDVGPFVANYESYVI